VAGWGAVSRAGPAGSPGAGAGGSGDAIPDALAAADVAALADAGVLHIALAWRIVNDPASVAGVPGLGAGAGAVHALGVLQALLGSSGAHGGGGGAARLGPQGHSRIARSIHNDAHSFIHSLASFALPYADAGLLGLAGACADGDAGRLANAMAGLLKDAAALPISDAELARAKAGYKLRVASDVETAAGARDFAAAQLLAAPAGAAAKQPASLAATLRAIDAVSASQVTGLAKAALAARPALAALASPANAPRLDAVAAALK
jgi:predicted Zn-dependent peptidase